MIYVQVPPGWSARIPGLPFPKAYNYITFPAGTPNGLVLSQFVKWGIPRAAADGFAKSTVVPASVEDSPQIARSAEQVTKAVFAESGALPPEPPPTPGAGTEERPKEEESSTSSAAERLFESDDPETGAGRLETEEEWLRRQLEEGGEWKYGPGEWKYGPGGMDQPNNILGRLGAWEKPDPETGVDGEGQASIENLFKVEEGSTAWEILNDVVTDPEVPVETKTLVEKLIAGDFTPEELLDLLDDPAFKDVYEMEDLGVFLSPVLDAAINASLAQADFAKDIEIEGIKQRYGLTDDQAFQLRELTAKGAAQDLGALLAAGGSADQIQEILSQRAGAPVSAAQFAATPFGALSAADSDTQELLDALRIQASGGLTGEENILGVQQAQAAVNPFAAAQLGQEIGDISTILRGGLTPEQQRQLAIAEQQGQLQANLLNFIGNPFAVGAARTLGTGAFGPFAPPAPSATATPSAAEASPYAVPFAAPDFAGIDEGVDMQALQDISDSPSGNVPARLLGLNRGPFNEPANLERTNLPATRAIGGARGLGPNFTLGQLQNLSETERGSVAGQLSAQGITPDQIEKRAGSFTPGERQRVSRYA